MSLLKWLKNRQEKRKEKEEKPFGIKWFIKYEIKGFLLLFIGFILATGLREEVSKTLHNIHGVRAIFWIFIVIYYLSIGFLYVWLEYVKPYIKRKRFLKRR